jgi:hypothetical protein
LLIAGLITAFVLLFDTGETLENFSYKDPLAYKYEGTYLVGEDIEAGEYVVYADPKTGKTNLCCATIIVDSSIESG